MGKKNLCPTPSIEGYYEQSKTTFQSMYNKALEKYPNLKDSAAIVNKLYNEIVTIDDMLGDAFAAWAKDNFPQHIHNSAITSVFKNVTEQESMASLFIQEDIMASYNDIHDIIPEQSNQEFKEGEHKDYSQNENQSSTTVYTGENPEYFKNRLFKAIGKAIRKKDYALIAKEARNLSFINFLDYIVDKFPDVSIVGQTVEEYLLTALFGEVASSKIKDPKKLQALKNFHIFNKPENRLERGKKKFYIITNWDGEKVLPRGVNVLQDKPAINLKTKRDESEFLTASFIDTSPSTVMGGKRVGEVVAYMSLNDMVELVQKGDDWYARDINQEYTVNQLNNWLKILIEQKQLTIASLKGGNSGTIILTKVQDIYYDAIINTDTVKILADKMDSKFLEFLRKNNFKLAPTIKKWKSRLDSIISNKGVSSVKNEAQVYNQMETLQRELSILGFNDYLDKEVSVGNIDQATKEIFLKNITELPVSGKYNEVTGVKETFMLMSDYLASIVARHEFLKGVRGNTYAMRQSLEDVFNRMRLPASEGLVDLEASPKTALIIDQSKVYYKNTETGKRIEPQQKIEGMKDKVDIDDGQLDMDSESIDEITYALGRQAALPYEHNPKEVKIVQYNHEQTPPGQEDNYIETKQEAFLAEPGFEIIDVKTDKVLVSVTKTDNDDGTTTISMYAGPATKMAGQRINQVMTLNEAKNLTGKYSFDGSHNIVELPTGSVRTIILPSTKAHVDAAMGSTWVNSFNINEPIYNKIRKKLNNFYKTIVDGHIDTFHKVATDPAYARKYLSYQTKIRDDATTEVQELYKKSPYGIHHPNNWKIFRRSIFNGLILENALKVRLTVDKTNPRKKSDGASSSLKLKQDKLGRIGLNKDGTPEGWYIGTGNDRIFNYVSDIYLDKLQNKLSSQEFVEARQDYIDSPMENKVNILNAFLKDNPIMANGVRQPVQHVGGSIMRNILGFLPDVGDSLVAHVKDVAFHWIGDGDGDTVNINIFPSQKFSKELATLLKDKALANQQTATSDLGIFEHAPTTNPANYKGFVDTMLSAIKYNNGQGIMTNLKTVASVLELKIGDNPIKFSDGTEVNVVKAKDFVVMDYAPLKQDVSKEDLPDFATIVNKNGSEYDGVGKKYLRTTAQHERLLLLNAATDNTKEHLISKMWKIDFDSVVNLMYKRTDGLPLTTTQMQILKKLNQMFNHSKLRSGRDPRKNTRLEDDKWYQRAKDLYLFLTGDAEYQLGLINQRTNLKKDKLSITGININKEMTTDEMLITRPYERMIKDFPNSQSSSPIRFSKNREANGHFNAVLGFSLDNSDVKYEGLNDKIASIIKDEKISITIEMKEAARKFINEFDTAWRTHLAKGRKEKSKFAKEPTSQIYSYDENMFEFISPWEKQLQENIDTYGEGFRLVASYLSLKGIGDVKRMNLLYKSTFYNDKVYDAYMRSWETIFFANDPNTGLNLMDSIRSEATSKRRVPDVVHTEKGCIG